MKITLLSLAFAISLPLSAHVETKDFDYLGVNSIFAGSPTDDPKAYAVEDAEYDVVASPYYWVVPGPGNSEEVISQKSNNNVAIEFFQNRLFLAFRTSKSHFAGKGTRMYIISTGDGKNWELEWRSETGQDAREPQLISYKGQLHFYYFTAGTKPTQFKPSKIYKITRGGMKAWSSPEQILEEGEVHWEMKVRDGLLWMTSYLGSHYRVGGGAAKLLLKLKKSSDGKNFTPENPSRDFVYMGGVSEAGFEFDADGNLYSVTRNEDGDASGFGAHLVFAPSYDLSYWSMASTAQAYESPRMFRHGKDLYLIARRQLSNAPFDWARRGGYGWRRIVNWLHYSLTAKTTSLFKMDADSRELKLVMDLPGAGDTAFPSIRRVNAHTFLVANYTSPLHRKYRKWIVGQLKQTKIYLIALKFVKKSR